MSCGPEVRPTKTAKLASFRKSVAADGMPKMGSNCRKSVCENCGADPAFAAPWSARVPLEPLFLPSKRLQKSPSRPGGRLRTGGSAHKKPGNWLRSKKSAAADCTPKWVRTVSAPGACNSRNGFELSNRPFDQRACCSKPRIGFVPKKPAAAANATGIRPSLLLFSELAIFLSAWPGRLANGVAR